MSTYSRTEHESQLWQLVVVLAETGGLAKKCMMAFLVFFLLTGITYGYPTVAITSLDLQGSENYNMVYASNLSTITAPHWTAVEGSPGDPVFYCMGKAINVRPTFLLSESWGDTAWVRVSGTNGLSIGTYVVAIQPGHLDFTFETTTTQSAGVLTNNTVGWNSLTFNWEVSVEGANGPWLSAGQTVNPCYVTLNIPQSPWSGYGNDGLQRVYVEMMYAACMLGWGGTNENSICQNITSGMYSWMINDDEPSDHFTQPNKRSLFYCRELLLSSTPLSGPLEGNDCRDFANFFKCAASALGLSSVGVVAVGPSGGGTFQTCPIEPARSAPLGSGKTVYFHQFNLKSGYAYDASLKLDGDTNNGNGYTTPGILPVGNFDYDTFLGRLSGADLVTIDSGDITLTNNFR